MDKDMQFLTETLIAHRGMHDDIIPENSIGAFKKAINNNYMIELDLHLLKDNNVVVFHDDNLKRMTGENKKISKLSYNEIKDLKLKNTNYKIPLFEEVLKLVNGKVPIVIELKSDSKVGLLEQRTMDILEKYKGKYVIKSFNPFSVYWLKKKYPDVIRGQLASDFKNKRMLFLEKWVLKNMFFNFITKPDFISYDINALPNKRVQKCRESKIILGWTVRNDAQMKIAKKYCDNFICENLNYLPKEKLF